jgi:hypothetical protein
VISCGVTVVTSLAEEQALTKIIADKKTGIINS